MCNTIKKLAKNPDRLGREQPMERTVEVQGNCPNFKQKLAEKEHFVISKLVTSHPAEPSLRRNFANYARCRKVADKIFERERDITLHYCIGIADTKNTTRPPASTGIFFAQLQKF